MVTCLFLFPLHIISYTSWAKGVCILYWFYRDMWSSSRNWLNYIRDRIQLPISTDTYISLILSILFPSIFPTRDYYNRKWMRKKYVIKWDIRPGPWEIEISNPEIGWSQPIDQTIRPWEIYEKERCSGSYRLAVDFILIKDYVNFSETRLVTVMKSLHRSCWTELTCQGILLP